MNGGVYIGQGFHTVRIHTGELFELYYTICKDGKTWFATASTDNICQGFYTVQLHTGELFEPYYTICKDGKTWFAISRFPVASMQATPPKTGGFFIDFVTKQFNEEFDTGATTKAECIEALISRYHVV